MKPDEIRTFLKDHVQAFDIYHVVERFEFMRHRPTGGDYQKVTLEVFDMGPEKESIRYSCRAISEEGREAHGNPAESIDVALSIVHWDDLDRDK